MAIAATRLHLAPPTGALRTSGQHIDTSQGVDVGHAPVTGPAALSAGRAPAGNILEIGQGTGVVYAEGCERHLIAVAQTDSERELVDTTFKQIAKHPFAAKMVGDARVVVLTLRDQWPSVERPVEIPLNGATISYHHEPQLD